MKKLPYIKYRYSGLDSEIAMESSLALTDALMRMRSRLRDENEKIILELQNDAARKIDLYIKDKLQIYQEDLKGKKESFIREIFQILEEKVSAFIHSSEIYSSLQQIIPKVSKTTASMDGNKIAEVPTHFFPVTPFSSHTSPSFPIPSTHSSLASPDTKNEQKNDAPDMAETHEIYDEDLNRIAQEFLQTYQSFIQSHQMNILKEIEDTTIGSGSDTNLYTDIELKGQLQWSNNMENAKNEWSEMGSKRLAIEESYKEILENEENTMIQYVNDQVCYSVSWMLLHPSHLISSVKSCI